MLKLILIMFFILAIPFQAQADDCLVLGEQIKGLRERVELQFDMVERALVVAKTDMDRRLEGMNEIRGQLDRQAKTFMPSTEIKQRLDVTNAAIERLRTRTETLEAAISKHIGSSMWQVYIIQTLIGLGIILFMAIFIRKNNGTTGKTK